MDDIDELLEDARRGIDQIAQMHAESMEAGAIISGMRPRIKSVLEHHRSALDYLVRQVNARYATKPPKKAYYPMARKPEHLDGALDANMPGVRKTYPAIAAVFAAHQPFVAGERWLGSLGTLVNGNKHNELTQQTQETDEQWRAANGAIVRGITFIGQGQEPTTNPTGFVNPGQSWTKETVTEWAFVKPRRFVVMTLMEIQWGVEATVKDVRHAADL